MSRVSRLSQSSYPNAKTPDFLAKIMTFGARRKLANRLQQFRGLLFQLENLFFEGGDFLFDENLLGS
jgi:hypothetical protein